MDNGNFVLEDFGWDFPIGGDLNPVELRVGGLIQQLNEARPEGGGNPAPQQQPQGQRDPPQQQQEPPAVQPRRPQRHVLVARPVARHLQINNPHAQLAYNVDPQDGVRRIVLRNARRVGLGGAVNMIRDNNNPNNNQNPRPPPRVAPPPYPMPQQHLQQVPARQQWVQYQPFPYMPLAPAMPQGHYHPEPLNLHQQDQLQQAPPAAVSQDADDGIRYRAKLVNEYYIAVPAIAHLGALPLYTNQSFQPALGLLPIVEYPFKNLVIADIEKKFQEEKSNGLEDPDFRKLRNYFVGKVKGKTKENTVFYFWAGIGYSTALAYFLEVEEDFLRKLNNAVEELSISVQVKVNGLFARLNEGPSSGEHIIFKSGTVYVDDLLSPSKREDGRIRIRLDQEDGTRVPRVYDPKVWFEKLLHLNNCNKKEVVGLTWSVTIDWNRNPLGENDQPADGGLDIVGKPFKLCNSDQFIQKLQGMYEMEDTSGKVTLVANNGSEIKAHKFVLTMSSETFMNMLSPQHDTVESRSGIIELGENSEEGLYYFVRYLYGFEVPQETMCPDLAVELFQLSNKYLVKDLEESLMEFFRGKGIDWFGIDDILELYVIVKENDSLEELRSHLLLEMAGLQDPVGILQNCEYYQKLMRENPGFVAELFAQLFLWK